MEKREKKGGKVGEKGEGREGGRRVRTIFKTRSEALNNFISWEHLTLLFLQ